MSCSVVLSAVGRSEALSGAEGVRRLDGQARGAASGDVIREDLSDKGPFRHRHDGSEA